MSEGLLYILGYLLAYGPCHLELTHQFHVVLLVVFGYHYISTVRFEFSGLGHAQLLYLQNGSRNNHHEAAEGTEGQQITILGADIGQLSNIKHKNT